MAKSNLSAIPSLAVRSRQCPPPRRRIPQNPFDDETGENADGKSKAEIAAEKKAWISEPDRDYTYTEVSWGFPSSAWPTIRSATGSGASATLILLHFPLHALHVCPHPH